MIRALLALIFCVFPLTSSQAQETGLDGIGTGAPLVIESSMGGSVEGFSLYALHLETAKVPVIVDGPCLSACTLLVDIDRANVCLTTNAILGYHKAATRDEKGNLIKAYNLNYETPGLNEYLQSRGGLPDPDDANLLLMTFDQAKHFYKPCKGAT